MARVINNLSIINILTTNLSTTDASINNINANNLFTDQISPLTPSGNLYINKNGGVGISTNIETGVHITGTDATYALNVSNGTTILVNTQPATTGVYNLGGQSMAWKNFYSIGSIFESGTTPRRRALIGYQSGTFNVPAANTFIYIDVNSKYTYEVNDGFTTGSDTGNSWDGSATSLSRYYITPPVNGKYLIIFKYIEGVISGSTAVRFALYLSPSDNQVTGGHYYNSTGGQLEVTTAMTLTTSSKLYFEGFFFQRTAGITTNAGNPYTSSRITSKIIMVRLD